VVFSMARVPLRTNCLQAARWWAEAQIFRPLASPRRPPATTGPNSKMPRETTSALIAAFRLLRGPKSSTCGVNRHGAIDQQDIPHSGATSGNPILPTRAATLAAMISDFDHATSRPLESRARMLKAFRLSRSKVAGASHGRFRHKRARTCGLSAPAVLLPGRVLRQPHLPSPRIGDCCRV
jgi:hypothetical protein